MGPQCCAVQCTVKGNRKPTKLPLPLGFRHPIGWGPSHSHRQHAHKFGNDCACGSGEFSADRQTNKQTHRDVLITILCNGSRWRSNQNYKYADPLHVILPLKPIKRAPAVSGSSSGIPTDKRSLLTRTLPDFAEVSGSQLHGELDFTARDFPFVTGFPREIVHLRPDARTWCCQLIAQTRRTAYTQSHQIYSVAQ